MSFVRTYPPTYIAYCIRFNNVPFRHDTSSIVFSKAQGFTASAYSAKPSNVPDSKNPTIMWSIFNSSQWINTTAWMDEDLANLMMILPNERRRLLPHHAANDRTCAGIGAQWGPLRRPGLGAAA